MMREPATARLGPSRPAQPAVRVDEPERTSWLLCRAATILVALPVEHVVEIMRMLPLEPFAGAPIYVRGLSIIRGAPAPVVDVGVILGGKITRSARLVAVRGPARIVALAVDEVIGLTAIAADALGRLPPLLQEVAADAISAIGARDVELLVFLRAGRLVPEDLFARLDAEGAAS